MFIVPALMCVQLEAKQQRLWAKTLHASWLAPLGLAQDLDDSLWALGLVRWQNQQHDTLQKEVLHTCTSTIMTAIMHSKI